MLSRHSRGINCEPPLCIFSFSCVAASRQGAVQHRGGQQPLLHLQRRTQRVGGSQPQLRGNNRDTRQPRVTAQQRNQAVEKR